MYDSKLCLIDPPAITSVDPSNICTNDFTVSWTAASDEEGISYGVTLLPLNITANIIMDTSYNITDLMPATSYTVHVFSAINTCIGIPDVTTVTTLAVEIAVPQSELLIIMHYIFDMLTDRECKQSSRAVFAIIHQLHVYVLICYCVTYFTRSGFQCSQKLPP